MSDSERSEWLGELLAKTRRRPGSIYLLGHREEHIDDGEGDGG